MLPGETYVPGGTIRGLSSLAGETKDIVLGVIAAVSDRLASRDRRVSLLPTARPRQSEYEVIPLDSSSRRGPRDRRDGPAVLSLDDD